MNNYLGCARRGRRATRSTLLTQARNRRLRSVPRVRVRARRASRRKRRRRPTKRRSTARDERRPADCGRGGRTLCGDVRRDGYGPDSERNRPMERVHGVVCHGRVTGLVPAFKSTSSASELSTVRWKPSRIPSSRKRCGRFVRPERLRSVMCPHERGEDPGAASRTAVRLCGLADGTVVCDALDRALERVEEVFCAPAASAGAASGAGFPWRRCSTGRTWTSIRRRPTSASPPTSTPSACQSGPRSAVYSPSNARVSPCRRPAVRGLSPPSTPGGRYGESANSGSCDSARERSRETTKSSGTDGDGPDPTLLGDEPTTSHRPMTMHRSEPPRHRR